MHIRQREVEATNKRSLLEEQLKERIQGFNSERQNMRTMYDGWLREGQLQAHMSLARAQRKAREQMHQLELECANAQPCMQQACMCVF